ncbi:unnamed protein product [Natator depressus]
MRRLCFQGCLSGASGHWACPSTAPPSLSLSHKPCTSVRAQSRGGGSVAGERNCPFLGRKETPPSPPDSLTGPGLPENGCRACCYSRISPCTQLCCSPAAVPVQCLPASPVLLQGGSGTRGAERGARTLTVPW